MTEKKWKTGIAVSKKDRVVVRGYDLDDLIGKLTFTEMIFLVLVGRMPSKKEAEVIDAILVAVAEHGIRAGCISTSRMAFSSSGSFIQGVSAGMLSLGKYHGGAVEECARILQELASNKKAEDVVAEFLSNKRRFPGFGHPEYTEDPRTKKLLLIAKKEGIFGKHCKLAEEIEVELEKIKGKKLCLNIDGAIAAIISDLGFDWKYGNAFFIIPRLVGISAHVIEEWQNEKPYSKKLSEDEAEYTGELNKKL